MKTKREIHCKRGFDLIAHFTPSELEKRYLTTEDGRLHGHINGTHCIVVAKVRKAGGTHNALIN
jgi:hypothetical protein